MTLKKSHKWVVTEILVVRCPYCTAVRRYVDGTAGDVGDIVQCEHCRRNFQLGEE